MEMPESVLQQISKAGMRLSIARIGVMQILQVADPEPLSAEEVYRRMSKRGTSTSLGTVYRTAKELTAHGLLLREWGSNRKAIYRITPSGFDAHRLRLVCQDCGHSVGFSDGALLTALERVAYAQGLTLVGKAVAIPCECRGCDAYSPDLRPCSLANGRRWPAAATNE